MESHALQREGLIDRLISRRTCKADLAGSLVDVVRILQQQSSCLRVVFLSGDVQRWKMDLSTGVVFQQQRHDLVVSLLQCHCQRCESVLNVTKKNMNELSLTPHQTQYRSFLRWN